MRVLIALAFVLALIVAVPASPESFEDTEAELAPPKSTCPVVVVAWGITHYGKDYCEQLIGTSGNETIHGDDGDGNNEGDYVKCQGGIDYCHGRDGNDSVLGGSGADKITGGYGNDVIGADDGFGDTIDCGPGTDYVYRDTLATEGTVERCEIHIVNGVRL